jgi:hypothetical protein
MLTTHDSFTHHSPPPPNMNANIAGEIRTKPIILHLITRRFSNRPNGLSIQQLQHGERSRFPPPAVKKLTLFKKSETLPCPLRSTGQPPLNSHTKKR